MDDHSTEQGPPPADTSAEAAEDDGPLSETLVEPDRVRVWEDEFKRLCVSVDGEERQDVRVRRVFPLSGKADYVSFMNRKGKEMAMIADPRELDPDSRGALAQALGRMYYVAGITRVDSIREKMGVGHWKVQTDRGYAQFEVADRSNIRRLPGGRYVIMDADGSRFEIEDVSLLDARSQALIFSEV